MVSGRLIPLPFPECKNCGRAWGQCIHASCAGSIDVEPISGRVLCRECRNDWLIWESRFLCPCEASFEAYEIEDALSEILDHCRQLVYELSIVDSSRARREELSHSSMREFLHGLASGLGRAAGMAVEIALKFLFPH